MEQIDSMSIKLKMKKLSECRNILTEKVTIVHTDYSCSAI